jgi:hypothetical protein
MQPTTYSASDYKEACAPAQAEESGTSCIRMQEIELVFYSFFATLLTFPHCLLRWVPVRAILNPMNRITLFWSLHGMHT